MIGGDDREEVEGVEGIEEISINCLEGKFKQIKNLQR